MPRILRADPPPNTEGMVCHACGCTDDRACLTPSGPCHWVEPGVCSGCACEWPGPNITAAMVRADNERFVASLEAMMAQKQGAAS